jgi:hypothetical protein
VAIYKEFRVSCVELRNKFFEIGEVVKGTSIGLFNTFEDLVTSGVDGVLLPKDYFWELAD